MRANLGISFPIAALISTAPSAKAGDYCILDNPSRGKICDFYTVEQARETASGICGTCGRDAFLNTVADACAYAPGAFNAKGRKQIKK